MIGLSLLEAGAIAFDAQVSGTGYGPSTHVEAGDAWDRWLALVMAVAEEEDQR